MFDEETEELSEDLENLSGDIADLTKTAKTPGGISLFTDSTKTTYKSIYQILKEIAAIYHDLDDKTQAALLEKLAGKRGGQVLAGLLNDFSEVERAMSEIEKSSGSADAEMNIITESLDYKINAFKETWTQIFKSLADRKVIGGFVDALTDISKILELIVSNSTAFNAAIAGIIGTFLTIKEVDITTWGSALRSAFTDIKLFFTKTPEGIDARDLLPSEDAIRTRAKEIIHLNQQQIQTENQLTASISQHNIAEQQSNVITAETAMSMAKKEIAAERYNAALINSISSERILSMEERNHLIEVIQSVVGKEKLTASVCDSAIAKLEEMSATQNLTEAERAEAIATLEEIKAKKLSMKETSKFHNLLKGFGKMAATSLVIAAIGKIISITKEWANQSEELKENLKKANEVISGSKSDIDNYSSSLKSLYSRLKDASLTTEEHLEINRELKGIQDELVEKYGAEASAIDLVTDSIEKQEEAIKRVNELKASSSIYNQWYEEATKLTAFQNTMVSFAKIGSFIPGIRHFAADYLGQDYDTLGAYAPDVTSAIFDNIDQSFKADNLKKAKEELKEYRDMEVSVKASGDEMVDTILKTYDNIYEKNGKLFIRGSAEEIENTIINIRKQFKGFSLPSEFIDDLTLVEGKIADLKNQFEEINNYEFEKDISNDPLITDYRDQLQELYAQLEIYKIEGNTYAIESTKQEMYKIIKDLESYLQYYPDLVGYITDPYIDEMDYASMRFEEAIKGLGSKRVGIDTTTNVTTGSYLDKIDYKVPNENIQGFKDFFNKIEKVPKETNTKIQGFFKSFDFSQKDASEKLKTFFNSINDYSEETKQGFSDFFDSIDSFPEDFKDGFIDFFSRLNNEEEETENHLDSFIAKIKALTNKSGGNETSKGVDADDIPQDYGESNHSGSSHRIEINPEDLPEQYKQEHYLNKLTEMLESEKYSYSDFIQLTDEDIKLLYNQLVALFGDIPMEELIETALENLPGISEKLAVQSAEKFSKSFKEHINERDLTDIRSLGSREALRNAEEMFDTLTEEEKRATELWTEEQWNNFISKYINSYKAAKEQYDKAVEAGTATEPFDRYQAQISAMKYAFNTATKEMQQDLDALESNAVDYYSEKITTWIDNVGEAYKSIFLGDKGFDLSVVNDKTLKGIKDQFTELKTSLKDSLDGGQIRSMDNALNDFLGTLTDSTTTQEQAQEAFDKYVTSMFRAAEGAKKLNEETAGMYRQMLKTSGIKNYDEVVQYYLDLGEAEKYVEENGVNLLTLNGEQVEALITLGDISEGAAGQLAMLAIQQQIINSNGVYTAKSVQSLYNLAAQAGLTGEALQWLEQIMWMFQTAENALANGDPLHMAGKLKLMAEQELERFQKALAEGHFAPEMDYSQLKDDAAKAGKEAGENTKNEYEKALEILDKLRDNDVIDEKHYLDQKRLLIEKFYKNGILSAEEYFEKLHAWLKEMLSLYNSVISDVTKILQKQIDSLEKERDKKIKEIEKARDAEIKSIDDQIEAIDKKIKKKNEEIEAMEKEHEARKQNMDLMKAEYELQRSLHQRVNLVYKEGPDGKGQMIYQADPKAIRDAQEQVDEQRYQKQLKILQDELEIYEKQKESLEEKKQSIEEYYQKMIDETNEYYDNAIQKIQDYIELWEELSEVEERLLMENRLASLGLSMESILNLDMGSFEVFKSGYLGLLEDIYSRNEGMNNLINENFGEVSGYLEATQSAMEGLSMINLESLTTALDTVDRDTQSIADCAGPLQENLSNSFMWSNVSLDPLKDSLEEVKATLTEISQNPYTVNVSVNVDDSQLSKLKGLGGSTSVNTGDLFSGGGSSDRGVAGFNGTVGAAFFDGYPGLNKAEQDAIRSEFGQPELTVYPNGTYEITTTPTISDLPKGTVIFNEEQTKRILKNNGKGGKAFEKGTSSSILPLKDAMPEKYAIMEQIQNALKDNLDKMTMDIADISSNVRDISANVTNVRSSASNTMTINGGINVTCPGVTEAEVAKNIGGALKEQLNGIFSGFALRADQLSMRR